MRRIGGRTEFDKHIAEFHKYDTVGEQHTDHTGSEQPKHTVHDSTAGKHHTQLIHGCFAAQQPVDDHDHAEQQPEHDHHDDHNDTEQQH